MLATIEAAHTSPAILTPKSLLFLSHISVSFWLEEEIKIQDQIMYCWKILIPTDS